MQTFSSILNSIPQPEETQAGVTRHLGAFVFACLVIGLVLFGTGIYWKKSGLIYTAVFPACLMTVAALVYVYLEMKDNKPFFKDPGAWLAERLDDRFSQEKRIAVELATTDLNELRRMRTRLEAFAAATIGVMAAAIAIFQGLIKLRTLSSTLHYAIELAEENRKPSFRKISRKRGQPA